MFTVIINTQTNEITEVPFTKEEKDKALQERAIIDLEIEKEMAKQKEKDTAKSALLERLGITEEEAALLLL